MMQQAIFGKNSADVNKVLPVLFRGKNWILEISAE
jgi:hypothetical protein